MAYGNGALGSCGRTGAPGAGSGVPAVCGRNTNGPLNVAWLNSPRKSAPSSRRLIVAFPGTGSRTVNTPATLRVTKSESPAIFCAGMSIAPAHRSAPLGAMVSPITSVCPPAFNCPAQVRASFAPTASIVRSKCTGISMACGDPGGVAMRTPSSASPTRVTSKRMLPTMALKLPVRCPSFSAMPMMDSPSDPNAGSAPWALSFPLVVSTPSTTSSGRAPVVEPIHRPSKALGLADDGPACRSRCEA